MIGCAASSAPMWKCTSSSKSSMEQSLFTSCTISIQTMREDSIQSMRKVIWTGWFNCRENGTFSILVIKWLSIPPNALWKLVITGELFHIRIKSICSSSHHFRMSYGNIHMPSHSPTVSERINVSQSYTQKPLVIIYNAKRSSNKNISGFNHWMIIFHCSHSSAELPNKKVSISSLMPLNLYCRNSNTKFNSLLEVHQTQKRNTENIVLIEWNIFFTNTQKVFGAILMLSLLMEPWSMLEVIMLWCHHYSNQEESFNINSFVAALLLLLSEQEAWRIQFLSLIWKPKKEMDSILCLMMFKTSKDACVEQSIASKTKNFIKSWEKMLLKVLLKFPMLPEAGTVNFIDSKTKFISIGKRLIDKLNHSSKRKKIKTHQKRKLKHLNLRKVSFGRELGRLKRVSNRFWKERQDFQ